MLAEVMSYGAYAHPGPGWADGHGPWDGGPGWWLVFPVLFWLLVLSSVGYLIYRRSPARSARSAAERILAELYARGEISAEELKQRRAVLRSKS
ncbi:SHOCT domain-containing protein [Micromonospora inositola]|uniref:Putative membrane protein n=1 Tax=Micromonospora inositola TaxID=47865 RepID=A0A1C5JE07_9ACTN|nr:SHOCT domain-containing protein [Micromonospora inositola]SCG68814.1 putative membrane protein [Micromonospora inositola]